jgi:hypothetical protein
MEYTGIPVPKGLRIEYDTMKQIVTLYWNTPTSGRTVSSYNVYRRNVDSNTVLARININPVTDTSFIDSTGVQDMTYEYRVAVVDTSASEGEKNLGLSVTVVSAFPFIKNFGTAGSGTGRFLTPADIAVDNKDRFWIADGNRKKIMCFDSTGTFITEWGDSTMFNNPYGIDIDLHQNIIVCDWDGSKVQKFDTLGNLIHAIDSAGVKIHDVSVDENENIYFSMVANGSSVYICKYDSTGKFVKSWQPQSNVLHYALLVRNGKVYCSGTILSSIQNPNDQYVIESFDTAGTPIQVVNLQQPNDIDIIQIRDLDIDASGRIYAVDPNNGKVRIFDSNLAYVAKFGRKRTGASDFSSIQGIAICPNQIAITDRVTVHLLQLP